MTGITALWADVVPWQGGWLVSATSTGARLEIDSPLGGTRSSGLPVALQRRRKTLYTAGPRLNPVVLFYAPDQRLASTAYLADGAITSAKLAPGPGAGMFYRVRLEEP